MSEKPVLAILGGTGNLGPGLGLRWAHAGYQVLIGSRQAEKAEAAAAEINQRLEKEVVVGYVNQEAAKRAEMCILTVVQSAHQPALIGLKDVLQGKILVDSTVRMDFRDPQPPGQPSAGRIAQDILGDGVTVVMAFQNVPASSLKKDLDNIINTDVLVCADDVDSAEKVIALSEGGGMRAYYAGSLEHGATVEGITAMLVNLNKHYGGHGSVKISGLKSN